MIADLLHWNLLTSLGGRLENLDGQGKEERRNLVQKYGDVNAHSVFTEHRIDGSSIQ